MPDFGHPFAGMAAERKVTDQELARAIRFSIAAEYEAIQLYMQLAESTDNQLAKAVLKDIADEEIVHAGEFLRLLRELEPREAALYAEGEAEVEQIMATLAAGKQSADLPRNSPVPPVEPGVPEAETATPGTKEQKSETATAETTATGSRPEPPKTQPPQGIGNLFGNP